MAASIRFFSVLTPQSLNRVGDGTCSPSATLFSHISLNPIPKFVSTLSYTSAKPISKFIRNVSLSTEFDEDVEEEEEGPGMEFSRSDEPSFFPDLKLFVGSLPFNVDSAGLAGLFEQAGNVEMAEVIYDKTTGRSRGFGFVTMSTIEEVEAAAQLFNGYELDGRALRVNTGPPPRRENNFSFPGSRSRSPRTDNFSFRGSSPRTSIDNTNRVHVGNLDWGVDDAALETLFRKQGNVKDATVIYDRENGRSRGFGFVTYSSPEEVSNAIRSLDGADLNGRSIRVSMAGVPSRREF